MRGRYIYQGELPCQREKDEAGRKKTELGAEREREREWDKTEASGADEGWGCQASCRAVEEDSDVVVARGGREEE